MKESIQFRLNGRPTSLTVDSDRLLLWVLRNELGLTGTKYGCGEALCGACTVLIDGEAARSCNVPVKNIVGSEVTTIEGLAQNGELHPLQRAFVEHNALQCGFCTPGMILTAYSLLKKKPNPTRDEIIAHMDDNLCRCGAHNRILQGILTASRAMKGA